MAREHTKDDPSDHVTDLLADTENRAVDEPEPGVILETRGSLEFEEGMQECAEDSFHGKQGIFQNLQGVVHTAVYNGFYWAGFGVVFGAMTLKRLIPADSAMASGLRDGAQAAQDSFLRKESEEPTATETDAEFMPA